MTLFSTISSAIVPLFLLMVFATGFTRRVKIYDSFVSGARDGLMVAIRLIPYLIAIFIAVGVFRDSGAMSLTSRLLKPFLGLFGVPAEILPLAVVRPLSGSAGLGVLADIFARHGPDSRLGMLASVMQGSTETTFYVLTVYFGAVAVRDTRHTLASGLLADLAAFIAALIIAPLF